jgi:hypothetical protein
MSTQPSVSELCTCCPYLDEFHANCTHVLRQTVLQELAGSRRRYCPLYPEIRAESMRELEGQLEGR